MAGTVNRLSGPHVGGPAASAYRAGMVRVAVVGAGFGGIGMAARLLEAGVRDLVVLERGDDVGGVWRDNTYPGAACDVPSHLYSFSFAPDGAWSRRFAPQTEIHAYLRRVAHETGVLPHVRLRTEVRAARFAEDDGCWHLELSDGSTLTADVLVTACGQLSRPAVPRIPGLDDFAGTRFHSAEWDHDHDLTGERVAVVGTGASAIQFVPRIAARTAALTVFQRSAPWILPKPDRAYGPRLRAALAGAPGLLAADRLRTYVMTESRSLGFNTEPRLLRAHAARSLRHLHAQVADPALRAALTPTDPIGCKRILLSDDWYPTFTQPHVRLVTDPVSHVEPDAVVTADGTRHAVDTIVLGTGFAATDMLLPMEVVGPGGRTLREAWTGGARAHLGTVVHGFPNLFLLYGPNTNLGHTSIVLMLEAQFAYVLQAVQRLRDGGWMDVRPEVQQAYDDEVQARLARTVFAGGCHSWYLTEGGRNTQNWPGTTLEFRRRLSRLRPDEFTWSGGPRPVAA